MSADILINPRYERLVRQHGLDEFDRVMHGLDGRTVGRHSRRGIEQIELEVDGQPIRFFLKREWQTYFKDRVRNWFEGLGWGTKARREWHALMAMTQAGLGCAEPVVVAERRGFRPQGYIVLREIAGAELLVPYLNRHGAAPSVSARRQFAAHLGREVARLHAAGINHPDLFSKHILLSHPDRADHLPQVWFIDMQRSSTLQSISFFRRVHDLASLDATMPPERASITDRLAFLQSYLSVGFQPWDTARFVRAIRGRSSKISRRRKINQMRVGLGECKRANSAI